MPRTNRWTNATIIEHSLQIVVQSLDPIVALLVIAVDGPLDLGNPFPMRDRQGAGSTILDWHAPFVCVVGINRAWRVGNDKVGLDACARPRADLRLDPGRQLCLEAERDQRLFARSEVEDEGVAPQNRRSVGCNSSFSVMKATM